MKVFSTILKILTALAAIAGIIYIAATYGDKIVAWAKKLLGIDTCDECCCEGCDEDCCDELEKVDEAPADPDTEAVEDAVATEQDFENQ